jgi:hypothetical protein
MIRQERYLGKDFYVKDNTKNSSKKQSKKQSKKESKKKSKNNSDSSSSLDYNCNPTVLNEIFKLTNH